MDEKQTKIFNVFGSRQLIEGSVIFSMFKNCTLFDDYKLNISDFKTEEGKLLFGLGKMMYDRSGVITIDRTTFELELSHHPDLKKQLDEYGGSRVVLSQMQYVAEEN